MTFFYRAGWQVQFCESDLKTPLPKKDRGYSHTNPAGPHRRPSARFRSVAQPRRRAADCRGRRHQKGRSPMRVSEFANYQRFSLLTHQFWGK
jgi:hypothetical protein